MLFGLSVGFDTFFPKILLHKSSKQNMFQKNGYTHNNLSKNTVQLEHHKAQYLVKFSP